MAAMLPVPSRSSQTPLPRKAVLCVGLAYVLSLLLVGGYLAVAGTPALPGRFVLSVIYMFVPLLSAVLIQKFVYRQRLAGPLRINFRPGRWWLVAWLLPCAFAGATLGVSLLFPRVDFSAEMAGLFAQYEPLLSAEQLEQARVQMAQLPVHPAWLILIQGLIAGATVNAIAAFGEEALWRGLLLTELLSLGFWTSSLVIGVVWGLWHAPLILMGHNYPQHPVAGVFFMTLFCVLLSPLMTWLTLRANSVIAAAVFHGTLNAVAILPIALVSGGSDLTVGVTGLAGGIVLILVNVVLIVMLRRRIAAALADED